MSRIVIAGGHGQIARHLIGLLAADGHEAVGLIRNPEHGDEVARWGGQPRLLDLEHADVSEVTPAVTGSDAVVFAAGAGPGSGTKRKDTVDRAGSVLLANAAEQAGVRRFIQISAFGAGAPVDEKLDETWQAYIRAKTAAEEDLRRRRTLDATILRPGRLTDDDPTGLVTLTKPPAERGDVTRADVAAVIVALLDAPATVGKTLMLTAGDTPIADAIAAL
ncbi:SDR family oxidoreductase [Aldersonia sp. NBC_00410]|uniref:SDR family oxidoreductase n=1 Tax=Aldersonia sp. NBC_00410 TaxID=2975954 RepID=UPI00224E9E2A|nr:SDR family oxidoreductase [Aldersonia sp. NBC_00410]MCX5045549.1 SDR family oxidoreductase [Aldersonia sp. NBC_00410]